MLVPTASRARRGRGRAADRGTVRVHAARRGGGRARRRAARPVRRCSCARRRSSRCARRPARRDDAAEEHLLLSQAPVRACSSCRCDRLARDCRGAVGGRAGRAARETAGPRRARARGRPGRGRRRDDRDRRGGRAGGRRRGSTRAAGDFTLVSEELGIRPRARRQLDVRRRRPDRRLDQRQARHSVLLALDRGRRRADDGRRPVRLRATTSAPARSGSAARGEGASLERRAARRRPPPRARSSSSSIEATRTDLVARHAPRARRRRGPRARDGLAGAVALPPRRRPRGRGVLAASPRGRSTSRPRSCSSREAGWHVDLLDDGPLGGAPLDLEGRSRIVAAATPRALRA